MSATEAAPVLHIRPARGWLNDPNGVTRYKGRWHVFFQHNPLRAQHGDIQWGHVSSTDLVTWDMHPVAFGPQPGGPDAGGCWSGTFLPWFERPAVVYTGLLDGPQRSTVCVRYGFDESLDTWSPPVVVAREPENAGIREMRDPYPFEWAGRRFALLGAGMTDGTPAVLLFSCEDPLSWQYEGAWLTGRNDVASRVAAAEIWECPQLVRFGDTYVLVVSLWNQGRLEDVVYLLGHQEGDASGLPRFVPTSGDKLDDGPDFYAPQVVQDEAATPLLFGWVRQENAPNDAPTDALAGCLTFPRRLALRDDRVHVSPHPALDALVSREVVPVEQVAMTSGHGDRNVALPPRSRVTIRTIEGAPATVDLVAGGTRYPVQITGGDCDIWLDGEVAEIYRPESIAGTIRQPRVASWSITGDLGQLELRIHELSLPRRSQ